jgi:hypothetical protein
MMEGLDSAEISRVIAAALPGPGGVALVVNVFANVPGVIHSPARRGIFKSAPERIHIGDWRYEVGRDGRLRASHFVNGIVIAEETLAAHAVGPHVAGALGQLVTYYGPGVIPSIDAALEALRLSGGGL